MRAIELMPENQLAWDLYLIAQLPGANWMEIAISSFPEFDEMTPNDMQILIEKMQIIAGVQTEVFEEEAKRNAGSKT